MKLNYRGIGYDANVGGAAANSNPTGADLNYRGVQYTTDGSAATFAAPEAYSLKYRGVAYGAANAADVSLPETAAEGLKYRGVAYSNNSAPAPETVSDLKYRGVAYESAPSAAPEVAANLKYRGITYNTNAVEAAAPTAVTPEAAPEAAPATVISTNERARALMMNHHRMVKQRQQVMLLRLAESVGLPVDHVAPYWNHIQGKVHPSFWATYDRSHASAS